MRWSKLVPVFILGAVAIDYVLIRPALLGAIPHLAILEFPLGALVVAVLIWFALRQRRAPAAPLPTWRKHQQVVRSLPDPAERAYAGPLARWLETGEDADRAAAILARAATSDESALESVRARLAQELRAKPSRRKRESVLKSHLNQGA